MMIDKLCAYDIHMLKKKDRSIKNHVLINLQIEDTQTNTIKVTHLRTCSFEHKRRLSKIEDWDCSRNFFERLQHGRILTL